MSKHPARRGRALAALFALLLAAAPGRGADPGLVLAGRVLGPGDRPLAGATVVIYTAGPRVGIGSVCPSCYPECRKSAVTDRRGRFAIAGLSEQLLYRLLVVADGHRPDFVDRVDPSAGRVEARLLPRAATPDPGLRTLVGHVVDAQGQPVAGASVSPQGIKVGESHMFGSFDRSNARIDPLAISDGNGEFRLTGPDSIDAWVLSVEARGLSPRVFPDVPYSGPGALLELDAGATVTGTVLRDGRPVPGAVIGICQVDRNALYAVQPDTIAADENGRFTFSNVPPNQDYAFSGVIESLAPWSLRTVIRTVGETDSVTTLPPFQLEPGLRLSGRVVLSDGKPVPPGTQLILGREFSGSYVQLPLDADGRFRLEGLPRETIRVGIQVKGYRIRADTPGFVGRMMGSVRVAMLRDRDDVELVLEPDDAAASAPAPRP